MAVEKYIKSKTCLKRQRVKQYWMLLSTFRFFCHLRSLEWCFLFSAWIACSLFQVQSSKLAGTGLAKTEPNWNPLLALCCCMSSYILNIVHFAHDPVSGLTYTFSHILAHTSDTYFLCYSWNWNRNLLYDNISVQMLNIRSLFDWIQDFFNSSILSEPLSNITVLINELMLIHNLLLAFFFSRLNFEASNSRLQLEVSSEVWYLKGTYYSAFYHIRTYLQSTLKIADFFIFG